MSWKTPVNNNKGIYVEEQCWYYLTHTKGEEGVYIRLKGISSKVNVIERFKFELAYYNVIPRWDCT